MKRLTCKIVVAAAVLLAAASLSSTAQVGINTLTPDSTALLDIHFSGTGQVGVLLPDVGDNMRQSKKEVSDGVVVFDRKRKMLYYYDEELSEWVAMTPIGVVHGDSKLKDIRPQDSEVNALNMSLGLNTNEVATAKLDVNGNVRVRKNMKVEGSDTIGLNLVVNGTATLKQSLQVSGNTTLQNPTTISSTLAVGGAMTVSSNIDAGSNTITAGTVNATYGTATVPVGGIIMWSGALNSWPSNWKLCDGANGTPNLQGRFIVSYAAYDGDYNSIGKSGGEKFHTLTVAEMPSHNHQFKREDRDEAANSDKNSGGSRGWGTYEWSVASSSYSTSSTGGGQAHENRPPYYVLAFIMRVQ
jgi:hypothetical protein